MTLDIKPLTEITREALNTLFQELGIVDTVRFLNQFTIGYGNYTEEREQLFAAMTPDEVITDIKSNRSRSKK